MPELVAPVAQAILPAEVAAALNAEIDRLTRRVEELEEALAAEREACAQVADEFFEATGWASKIAAAIRARK